MLSIWTGAVKVLYHETSQATTLFFISSSPLCTHPPTFFVVRGEEEQLQCFAKQSMMVDGRVDNYVFYFWQNIHSSPSNLH